ncbi:MAG TPA: ATP-binding protein [Vicinamibacteria bacterium]|nr:ATP-binding protein [Vicinamibacteria bacterium]
MEFRERALHEARRYGADPFVFVRELVQNARDADARAVHFEVTTGGDRSRVACRDDGAGMSLDHARRFLFTLYASSKEKKRDAGRFGVGFWSVLRFAPSRIVVRSWPRRGAAWEVALSGDLAQAMQAEPPPCPLPAGHGTEVALERPGDDEALLRRVRDAAWQGARFVARRADPLSPLDLRVNGAPVTAPFELPRPSATFRRGLHRGVVALGREARVELFARGLRVRSAAALHDLAVGASSASRVRFPETEGLVPQALLDGGDLEPLLARSDVRDDRSLRRLQGLAEGALAHLVERQLALARPEAPWRRTASVAAIVGLLAVGAALGRLVLPPRQAPVVAGEPSREAALRLAEGVRDVRRAEPQPFSDLSIHYSGPRASSEQAGAGAPLLLYRPAESRQYLAALLLDDVTAPPPPARRAGPYRGAPCGMECLAVTLLLEGGPGVVRLPRASGHVLDPASLRVGGRHTPLGRSPAGEPVLVLERSERQVVSYRSGPGSEPEVDAPPPEVPDELLEAAAAVRQGPIEERVAVALRWVRDRVRYSTAVADVARHRVAEAAGEDVLERALEVGAGDCDVQNAVLAALLRTAGVRARLAVGHVGENGSALPALHAWVEWVGASGRVRVADASEDLARAGDDLLVAAASQPSVGHEAVAWRALGPAVVLAALAGLAGWGLVRIRTERRVALDPAHDVARLLRGALAQPDAFRRAPAVFERRLVPLFPRGVARLGEAWNAATHRRLFRSERGAFLAVRVARAGALVVDTRRAEGRVVADALGAVDLDAWDALLARSRGGRLLGRVERAFRAAGEPVTLRHAAELGGALVLDRPLGRLSRGTHRTLVVDTEEPWLRSAERLAGDRPAEAVFSAADRVASLLRLREAALGRVLAPLAEAALRERP